MLRQHPEKKRVRLIALIATYPFAVKLLCQYVPGRAFEGIIGIWVFFVYLLCTKGKGNEYGLCMPKKAPHIFIPALLLILPNLFCLGELVGAGIRLRESLALLIGSVVWEEIVFRGLLLNGLLKRYPHGLAVIMQGILFGIMHLVNLETYASLSYAIVQMIVAAGAGVWLGAIAWDSGSIWWGVLFHTAINCSAMLAEQSGIELGVTMLQGLVDLTAAVVCMISGVSIAKKADTKVRMV